MRAVPWWSYFIFLLNSGSDIALAGFRGKHNSTHSIHMRSVQSTSTEIDSRLGTVASLLWNMFISWIKLPMMEHLALLKVLVQGYQQPFHHVCSTYMLLSP
jgi:hypothetical protein